MVGSHCKPQRFYENNQAFLTGYCCCHGQTTLGPGLDDSQNPGWKPGSLLAFFGVRKSPYSLEGGSLDTEQTPKTRLPGYQQSWIPEILFLKAEQSRSTLSQMAAPTVFPAAT